jgi:spermidine/putrescine transport system substrate-binding protein
MASGGPRLGLRLFLSLGLVALLIIVYKSTHHERPVLNVLNWDFYIGPTTVRDFEKEYDVTVNYGIYKDNEECLRKITSSPGVYDIIIPGDYMINTMVSPKSPNDRVLEKLDLGRLTNLKNIGDKYRGNYYDPHEDFCVPYMFGVSGFAVNRDFVKDESISWSLLTEPRFKGHVAVVDDMRFTLGSVLMELGKSPNTTNPDDLNQAVALLQRVKPNILKFTPDSGKDLLISGAAWVAYAYSGDVLQAERANPKLTFQIPVAGSIRFQDGVCIPKGAPNKELAEKFINFLLRPDVSAGITNEVMYGNTNEAALPLIRQTILSNPASFPGDADFAKCQPLKDVGDGLKLYETAWEKVKG